MKKILLIVAGSLCVLDTKAQDVPHWALGLNIKLGQLKQELTMIDYKQAYGPNNQATSYYKAPIVKDAPSKGCDVELAYFFNKHRTLGISVGLMYQHYSGTYRMDSLYMDYEATDARNRIYRRIISSNGELNESVLINTYSVPLLLQFKKDFRKSPFGFWLNAGVVFGITNGSFTQASGNFNYEAVYLLSNDKYAVSSGFDAQSGPKYSPGSLVLTQQEFYTTHRFDGGKSAESYFDYLRNQGEGFNVGLRKNLAYFQARGYRKYTGISVGGMVQAGFSMNLGKNVQLLLGGGLMYQPWDMESNADTRLTDQIENDGGNYRTITGTIKSATYMNYWVTGGFRFSIGDRAFSY